MSFVNRAASIANHPYLNGAAIPAVFGDGLLGKGVNGGLRIPALLATCAAVTMLGELSLRGLTAILPSGMCPAEDGWLSNKCTELNIRPFKKTETYALTKSCLKVAAFGIVLSEFVRIAGGSLPRIYDIVLPFFGPIRLSSDSYIRGVLNVVSSIRS